MTSIKWLKKELETHGTRDVCVIGWEELDSLFQQAMDMELKQKESDFVDGYKERAIISNLIFDESSMILAKQLFSNKLENQKQLIVEIMEEDSKDGLYDIPLQECVNCNEQKQVHSMCLDCCIKLGNQNKTEISDEEIEKVAEEYSDSFLNKGVAMSSFMKGCYWYREQLKNNDKRTNYRTN